MDGASIIITMALYMREILPMEGNKALELLYFLMVPKYKRIGNRPMFRVRARYSTPMATFTTASTTCHKSTARAYTSGALTTPNTKANSKKTPSKVKPAFISPKTSIISAAFATASVTVKAIISTKTETLLMESGKMIQN